MEIPTHFGDVWAVSDNTGAIARYVVPVYYVHEAPHQTITITSEGIANAAEFRGFGAGSLDYSFPISSVVFFNRSSGALDLHYISANGADQTLSSIPGGSMLERIDTVHFGDFYYLSEPGRAPGLVYVATEPTEQTVSITDAAVAYRLGE